MGILRVLWPDTIETDRCLIKRLYLINANKKTNIIEFVDKWCHVNTIHLYSFEMGKAYIDKIIYKMLSKEIYKK